eukprot:CAMPEP_0185163066 /NCGR_PEP_ID=MMETSP1139-20130426/7490_1 /TAXON_ID=298111 /ORGANISM="Pavlova sp., Strain CCMP459" /LENGTH=39 /DNA_ID=CAMNT_0027728415 /DNA_START=792 /DNA_END=907 /DNA_ORIENTATION=+
MSPPVTASEGVRWEDITLSDQQCTNQQRQITAPAQRRLG